MSDVVPLTLAEQHDLLAWLHKGASFLAACQQLDVDIARLWVTLEQDAGFSAALQRMFDALSHNVIAGVYRQAMEGNVTAQQFWLKCRPAPLWQSADRAAECDPHIKDLTDAELQNLIEQAEADYALASARGTASTPGPAASGGVP